MSIEFSNVVYIGKKFFMRYVMALLFQFNILNHDRVLIKARGKAISKAVHVAETLRRTFMPEVKYGKIVTGSVTIESSGRRVRVSSIEIELKRHKH